MCVCWSPRPISTKFGATDYDYNDLLFEKICDKNIIIFSSGITIREKGVSLK